MYKILFGKPKVEKPGSRWECDTQVAITKTSLKGLDWV